MLELEQRPAAPPGQNAVRAGVQFASGAVALESPPADAIVSIVVWLTDQLGVPAEIREPVETLVRWGVGIGVAALLAWYGARRRDMNPDARTLLRTPI